MSRPTKPQVKRAKTVGPTEDTGTSGMAPSMEVGMGALNFIPTVFRWWTNPTVSVEENPKKVRIVSDYVLPAAFPICRSPPVQAVQAGYLLLLVYHKSLCCRFVLAALLTRGNPFR